MSFVLPKCATSSVRSVPCELARTSAFRSMGRYSTAKAASANRIKNKAVRAHDTFPVQSVTVSFYDDAENQKFLLTVYSDGVCILNSAFVSVKYPGGGAAQLYEQLAGMGK